MDYTIKLDIAATVTRHVIDSAVHGAVSRFRGELGDHAELASDIATIAAETALEQFKTWANSELRLIKLEHERRASHLLLNPSRMFVGAETKTSP